jgi:hypothetical protein
MAREGVPYFPRNRTNMLGRRRGIYSEENKYAKARRRVFKKEHILPATDMRISFFLEQTAETLRRINIFI